MSTSSGSAHPKYPALKDLSPESQSMAHWFRQLARGLRTCRLYERDNPIVVAIREKLFEEINDILREHGALPFRVTPVELFLREEAVVRPSGRSELDDIPPGKEEMLPYVFYRDGIRALTLFPPLPRHDFDALYDALIAAGPGMLTHDDLVTLMWQANPVKIQVDAVPAVQQIYLSSRRPGSVRGLGGLQGLAFAWSPSGGEIHADLGQTQGAAQGLHRDTFDDWPLPEKSVPVPEAFAALTKGSQFARTMLTAEWASERGADWTSEVPPVVRLIASLDSLPETKAILSLSIVGWLADTIMRAAWAEAQDALTLIRELDPEGEYTDAAMTQALDAVDADDLTERLDESAQDDQYKFFGLTVAIGKPALGLACAVMAKAQKSRTRAAACTMLCYLCNDRPDLLKPYLSDNRWYVVRNAAFVLGQIGGPDVIPLLRGAAMHPDPRVRRQVIQSLGGVPALQRRAILLGQLQSRDPQVLAATLNMLSREQDPALAREILRKVNEPEFENRTEDEQRALLGTLGDVATDDAVPALEILLNKGGWFARKSFQRTAVARALQRIGTERALAVLEVGLKSRNEAVRNACLDAMAARSHP